LLRPRARKQLLKELSRLPNVRFTPRQEDMRPVYRRTRIVLAPSQCREGWGRVASEAHVSGIPVIGSRLGGLIESIGPGGIQLDPHAPASEWCAALSSLWHDTSLYQMFSERARNYARRAELDEAFVIERMMGEIEAAIAVRRAYPAPSQEAQEHSRNLAMDGARATVHPALQQVRRVGG
jgi:glycosyltransferase involved in cell wall biosynthesis